MLRGARMQSGLLKQSSIPLKLWLSHMSLAFCFVFPPSCFVLFCFLVFAWISISSTASHKVSFSGSEQIDGVKLEASMPLSWFLLLASPKIHGHPSPWPNTTNTSPGGCVFCFVFVFVSGGKKAAHPGGFVSSFFSPPGESDRTSVRQEGTNGEVLRREFAVLSKLKHENIVQAFSMWHPRPNGTERNGTSEAVCLPSRVLRESGNESGLTGSPGGKPPVGVFIGVISSFPGLWDQKGFISISMVQGNPLFLRKFVFAFGHFAWMLGL